MNITKEQIKQWLEQNNYITSDDLILDMIHDCIQDLGPKWVSVEDGLPEPYVEKVLVSSVALGEMVTTGIHTPEYGNACFECDINEDEMGQEPELHHIDHWMPLPSPPSETLSQ